MDGLTPLHWRRIPERYRLCGSYCETCKTYFFPMRAVCPKCRRKGVLRSVRMPSTGKIISFTKVFVPPAGFEHETPYFLAIVELDNGARLLAQIVDSSESSIRIGARVEKVFRKIAEAGPKSIIAYGYKFRVIEGKH